MLIGQYEHTIDTKKRLSLPSKFRKELGRNVVITKGIDDCLFVYSEKEWKEVSDKIGKLPANKSEARIYARFFLGGAMEVSLDKLGRILIPDYLKDYAGLNKNIIVLGLSRRLEIWDSGKWKIYKSKTEKKAGKVVSKLENLEI